MYVRVCVPTHAPECQAASQPAGALAMALEDAQPTPPVTRTHTAARTTAGIKKRWNRNQKWHLGYYNNWKWSKITMCCKRARSLWHGWRRRCRVAFKNVKYKQKQQQYETALKRLQAMPRRSFYSWGCCASCWAACDWTRCSGYAYMPQLLLLSLS